MAQKIIHCSRCNHDQKVPASVGYGDQHTCVRCGLDGELDLIRGSDSTYILK